MSVTPTRCSITLFGLGSGKSTWGAGDWASSDAATNDPRRAQLRGRLVFMGGKGTNSEEVLPENEARTAIGGTGAAGRIVHAPGCARGSENEAARSSPR